MLTCLDGNDNDSFKINDTTGLLNSLSESDPCEELQIDGRTEGFLPDEGDPLATNFELLRHENDALRTFYGFPMYFSNDVIPTNFIFFTGRRWALEQVNLTLALEQENPKLAPEQDDIDWLVLV